MSVLQSTPPQKDVISNNDAFLVKHTFKCVTALYHLCCSFPFTILQTSSDNRAPTLFFLSSFFEMREECFFFFFQGIKPFVDLKSQCCNMNKAAIIKMEINSFRNAVEMLWKGT